MTEQKGESKDLYTGVVTVSRGKEKVTLKTTVAIDSDEMSYMVDVMGMKLLKEALQVWEHGFSSAPTKLEYNSERKNIK